MRQVVANVRTRTGPLTGVQRYVFEICSRLNGVSTIAPRRPLHGPKGHIWEQVVLPGLLDGAFLFSPANTGPLAVNDQVVTIHDMSALDHPEWFSWKFSAWYRFLLPRLATKVRKVVADSEFTKQRICECTGISPDLVVVIPLGVDKRPNTGLVSGVEAQKMAGLPSATYLLTVSSLVPRKNLDGLIEAWKNIEHRLPSDVWLVLSMAVGVRRVFSSGKRFAQCKRVVLVGAVNDETLEGLYRGAVGFVYVSHYEGFSLSRLEA